MKWLNSKGAVHVHFSIFQGSVKMHFRTDSLFIARCLYPALDRNLTSRSRQGMAGLGFPATVILSSLAMFGFTFLSSQLAPFAIDGMSRQVFFSEKVDERRGWKNWKIPGMFHGCFLLTSPDVWRGLWARGKAVCHSLTFGSGESNLPYRQCRRCQYSCFVFSSPFLRWVCALWLMVAWAMTILRNIRIPSKLSATRWALWLMISWAMTLLRNIRIPARISATRCALWLRISWAMTLLRNIRIPARISATRCALWLMISWAMTLLRNIRIPARISATRCALWLRISWAMTLLRNIRIPARISATRCALWLMISWAMTLLRNIRIPARISATRCALWLRISWAITLLRNIRIPARISTTHWSSWLHHQTYLVANMSFLPALNLWRAWQNTGIGKVFKKLRHCWKKDGMTLQSRAWSKSTITRVWKRSCQIYLLLQGAKSWTPWQNTGIGEVF